MNHNPFLSLNDGTEVTYSDLKRECGKEYITIYSETPSEETNEGFNSFEYIYPENIIENVVGYTQEEIEDIMCYISKSAAYIYELAKEEEYCLD